MTSMDKAKVMYVTKLSKRASALPTVSDNQLVGVVIVKNECTFVSTKMSPYSFKQ